jgi:hypothetical protein
MTPGGVPGELFRFDGLQLLSARYGEEAARAWITIQLQHYQEAVSQVATVPVSVQACAQEACLGVGMLNPGSDLPGCRNCASCVTLAMCSIPRMKRHRRRFIRGEVARQARLSEQQTTTQARREISARFLSHYQQPCIWSIDRGKAEQWLKLFYHEQMTGEARIE